MDVCAPNAKGVARYNRRQCMNDHESTSGIKDRNDLGNYTEVDENFFDDILYDIGNEEEILKIEDSIKLKHPRYYVWTSFLIE